MAITELERIAEELTTSNKMNFPEGFIENPGDWENARYVRLTEKTQNDFFLQYSKQFREGNYEIEYVKREQITASNASYLLVANYLPCEDHYNVEITPKRVVDAIEFARSRCFYGQDFDFCKPTKLMLPKTDEGDKALKDMIKHVFEIVSD